MAQNANFFSKTSHKYIVSIIEDIRETLPHLALVAAESLLNRMSSNRDAFRIAGLRYFRKENHVLAASILSYLIDFYEEHPERKPLE